MCRNRAERSSAPRPWARARRLIAFAVGLSVGVGYGQVLIPGLSASGTARLRMDDSRVLELREQRLDLPCAVSRTKPDLDWDFTFHAGYEVEVPWEHLAGTGSELKVIFRVIPADHPQDPVYMEQTARIPAVEEGRKGNALFTGVFSLGEGKFHVDWLMRDGQERFCAMFWDVETKLSTKESPLKQWVPRSLIQPVEPVFAEEPPVVRASESGLPHVGIIVNFDPADPTAVLLDYQDVKGLVAILRRIARDPRIGTFSLIACSFETQQLVYKQENTSRLDVRALGEALRSLKLGMVDAKRFAATSGPAQFATDLIREELSKDKPDALVVLGRKSGWETRVSRTEVESLPGIPTFYLSYNPGDRLEVWEDSISTLVKRLRGFEYGVTRPRDLFTAWSDVVSRVAATQAARPATATDSATR